MSWCEQEECVENTFKFGHQNKVQQVRGPQPQEIYFLTLNFVPLRGGPDLKSARGMSRFHQLLPFVLVARQCVQPHDQSGRTDRPHSNISDRPDARVMQTFLAGEFRPVQKQILRGHHVCFGSCFSNSVAKHVNEWTYWNFVRILVRELEQNQTVQWESYVSSSIGRQLVPVSWNGRTPQIKKHGYLVFFRFNLKWPGTQGSEWHFQPWVPGHLRLDLKPEDTGNQVIWTWRMFGSF